MYGFVKKLPVIIFTLLISGTGVFAAQPEPPRPRPGEPPQAEPRRDEGVRERADRAIEMIRATDPNKAAAFEALRKSDPNQFGRELREYFRSRRPANLGPDFFDVGDRGRGGPEGQGRPEGREGMRPFGPPMPNTQDMEKEKAEFEKWLKDNYPDVEKRFAEQKKRDPEGQDRRAMAELRPYIGLYYASKYNPKLAEILKQDIPLRSKRRELVEAINKTTNPAEKARLTEQLLQVVEKRFDLLVQQKELEHEMLMQWLKDLEKRIGESKSSIEEMKKNARGHIDKQMQDLLAPRPERPRSQN